MMKRYLLIIGLMMCFVGIKAQTVDTKIAVNSQTDDKTFVVIVSNENYKNEESVPFAKNDGEVFKVYCQKTLGIPEDHIRFSPDATLGEMNYAIYWLGNMLKAYDGEARAIVYYSGHGMPDEGGKEAYLLPVDGFSQSTEGALSTKSLYKKLGDMNSKNIIVFLDACFSGAKRDGKMLASSRGVAIKAKTDPVSDNTVVFSAAQGDETAYPYKSQRHGNQDVSNRHRYQSSYPHQSQSGWRARLSPAQSASDWRHRRSQASHSGFPSPEDDSNPSICRVY